MKHLIIYSHLNPNSFTKAVADKIELTAKNNGDEVKIIDLYNDNFNPVLAFPDIEHAFMGKPAPSDVATYQEMITWADHMTFVYPLWWGQMPAMLKGFLDRVFANGFAFEYSAEGMPNGLLKGKSAKLFILTGTPNELYEQTGMHKALNRVNDEGIFGFCGITCESQFFGNIAAGPKELRTEYLESIS